MWPNFQGQSWLSVALNKKKQGHHHSFWEHLCNLTKNVFHQQSGSLCGKARCNFLDDIALAFPEARIALGFLQRGVLLLLQLLDAKGFAGLPFLPLFKDDGQKIQKRCFVSGGLRLLVLWAAGDIVNCQITRAISPRLAAISISH